MDGPFDYISTVQRLGMVMRFLGEVDLNAIIETTEKAHTVGPFIDPTKYRDALQRGDMDAMRDLAAALRPAVAIWRERIEPKITATA